MKKDRSALAAMVTSAALLLSLTGCAGTGESPPATDAPASSTPPVQLATVPETVPFALPVFADASLHPVLGTNRTNLTLVPLMYEGLYALDNSFTPQAVLCRSAQADESGLVWTFTLREEVTFSDGSPLTAADAVNALNTARRADSRYYNRLAQIQRVEAAGEHTLTVTLNSPNGALPALLDIPIYRDSGGGTVGTGPYVLGGTADAPVLTARADWWQDKTLPTEEIPLTPVYQTEELIHAFDTREAGLVTADLTGTAALGYSASYEVWDYPTTDMVYLCFNTRSGRCGDLRLRQALARGVDRASITNSLFARRVTAAQLPVSPNSPLYDGDTAALLDYSLPMMNSLLSQAQRPKDLIFVVNSENSFKAAAADFLAEQWRGAGVEVTVKKLSWEDYTAALSQGEFDLCLSEVTLFSDFDLTALLSSGGGLNYGGWSDEETDRLLALARAAGEEERQGAFLALERRLADQVPLLTLCFKNHSVLTQWKGVSGLTPTQNDPFYGLNWSLRQ